MNVFGNAKKQNADPDFHLPGKRRVIWEHSQDLAVYLLCSVILNLLFAIAIFIMGTVLALIYTRPPYVLTQEQGYVYYRNSEVYKLRSDIVRTFVRTTTTSLISYNPGGVDFRGLENLVDDRVIAEYNRRARVNADRRLRFNMRRIWAVQNIRRYNDRQFAQFLTIAVLGELIDYEDQTTREGLVDLKTTSKQTVLVVYLEQQVPSPDNPWGLKLVGLTEESEPQRRDSIWDASVEIAGTQMPGGDTILPARQELLPPPLDRKVVQSDAASER